MFLYVENRRMVTTEMYRSVMCVPEDERVVLQVGYKRLIRQTIYNSPFVLMDVWLWGWRVGRRICGSAVSLFDQLKHHSLTHSRTHALTLSRLQALA
jgi:hypothetical protein